jgi:plasmid stabilization system protein ParE
MYTYILLPKAYQELIEAWEWYEEIQEGLGDRFRDEIDVSLRYILNNPFYFEIKSKEYREASTKIFPYLIIYQVQEASKLVIVVSVFHSSRNPKLK